jgi:Rrf2 family iron-sulfur cluster assembly transcriptional regulator
MTATYALVAVGYIAENQEPGPVMAARISKEFGITLAYLLKVLLQLTKANILKSKRGPRGGYTLAREPKDISMLQIIEAIDGSLMRSLYMAEQTHSADFGLKMDDVYKKAAEKEIEIYDKAILSDML